ncbi:MAG: dTDP-4-amino-4,6-dideoxygalactose transaminase [Crocinitomicaceae bacterium]|jgi:dTDP-4-amino-4,6-dideoxygalactose transaminase|nr:dTDP-4-amino-4,6-dideoxygalactose transaminase [Crocinitomicaceae bacterium]
MIDFNLPYLTGDEEKHIFEAVRNGKISGNGKHTNLCQEFFENRYGFKKALLTTSCTDALEMSALLSNLKVDDEVIVPSYTFVSSALAFVRERAKIVFADSLPDHPNVDTSKLEALITSRTKVIVVVHYAGVACDMDVVMDLAKRYNLIVVEDAAQAIDSTYKGKPLGSIGHFGTFSFHETKNIQCGEGGLLAINDEKYSHRAEIIWEKGTNRAEFFRGEVNKYGWVDIGSSFLPSEITSAYLYAQLLHINEIQSKRKELWKRYFDLLKVLDEEGVLTLPEVPSYATNNAHMFFFITKGIEERSRLISHLRKNGIHAVFHYLALHNSEYYLEKHDDRELPNSLRFENSLLRLPLFNDLKLDQVDFICESIKEFYRG